MNKIAYLINNDCQDMLNSIIVEGLGSECINDANIELAVQKGNVVITEMLIDAGGDSKVAIKEAIKQGNLNILKMLKQKGINIGEYVNNHNELLVYTLEDTDVKMFKFFIREGVDVKSKWRVVIPYCIIAGKNDLNIAKIVKMIIYMGVDVDKCIAFDDMFLIEEAKRKGYKRVLRLFLKNDCISET